MPFNRGSLSPRTGLRQPIRSVCPTLRDGRSRSVCPSALRALLAVVVALVATSASAQRSLPTKGGSESKNTFIPPSVKAWKMTDDFTQADTVVVDTILAEHQVHNPIWRNSVSNVTLGNLGSPSVPTYYPALRRDEGNVFYNSLKPILLDPEQFTFYNTKTPYANLTYQKGIPKRLREEFFRVLFTQNVNSRVNIGARMDLNYAVGRYQHQGAYNSKFGIWASADGEVYSMQLQGWYQKFEIEENGGVENDSMVIAPENFDYDKAEDIPVNFMDAKNRLASYRLLYSHKLDLGSVTRMDEDSAEYDVPVATAFHKLYVDYSHHEFTVDDLGSHDEQDIPPAILDPSRSHDSRKYMLVSNTFQIKLNEEFNSVLRFGLRAFIGNEIRQYRWDAPSEIVVDEEYDRSELIFHRNKENRVTTFLGGQMSKSQGERLRWGAGVKFYFQGYNTGDIKADGHLDIKIGNGTWATNLWGKASFELRSPTLWEEKYLSNHYEWDQLLDREQTLDISAGLRVPGVGLSVEAFSSTQHNRVFFGADGIPDQKSGVTQVMGIAAREHFCGKRTGLNSIIRVAFQKTSDNDVTPAPALALYATSYWETLLFGVLTMQVGLDVRYNTKYYTPAYEPAIMQFVPQSEREIGGYGYLDPFFNFHLKKIRAYVKYEHVNGLWGSNDHFHTIHYPANPQTFKFGLSWNFYD